MLFHNMTLPGRWVPADNTLEALVSEGLRFGCWQLGALRLSCNHSTLRGAQRQAQLQRSAPIFPGHVVVCDCNRDAGHQAADALELQTCWCRMPRQH